VVAELDLAEGALADGLAEDIVADIFELALRLLVGTRILQGTVGGRGGVNCGGWRVVALLGAVLGGGR
jgi:hypothetical protein